MGRLAAKNDTDREMHLHLKAASRSLQKALAVVVGQRDPAYRSRVRRITNHLRGLLSSLEGIGSMQPGWDTEDPDLVSESEKRPSAQRRQAPPPPNVAIPTEGGD